MIINFLQKKWKIIIFVFLAFFVGLFIDLPLSQDIACDKFKYKYINPDLVCDDKTIVSKKSYRELKVKVEDFISLETKAGKITNASIYFRDLQNGPTLGINEYEEFSPASLLKLPLFLTYLKLEIDQPEILSTEIGFNNVDKVFNQYYPAKVYAKENTEYKISELLNYMIKYSDNNSYYALHKYLLQNFPDTDLMLQTFKDLGIIDPKNPTDQTISVKSYSSIFVQLYHNSFFPNRDLSEYALDMLVDTDFKEGITQGIPIDIKVAHKFGERSGFDLGEKQLHDCGIVYYPENPYLLCVMTKGPDFFVLSQFISKISEMVYEEFDSRKL
ncbi:MAG: serine hydrolase [Candidatus Pacebacteria bacterium]|nr:serine hydrolase [Candidatus Paceibacterota bacterium]